VGAIIGSGIFALTGTAAAGEHGDPSFYKAQVLDLILHLIRNGDISGVVMYGRPPAGPAIAISFLLVAVACVFAGLCYAELASMIPIAGSAYTYSYATLGELTAWIIGWDLILEYAVSNVAVAVSFGGYLKAQLASFNILLPDKWSTPVWTPEGWSHSYFNVPAFLIVFVLTVLLVRGVRESTKANNIMVLIKIGAILLFLVVGGMLVQPANWHPFAPSGFPGIMAGGAIIFFTYIGFDSVSTAAEEAKDPQRDIPFGIIVSLVVCTVLYVGVAIVLLGMMPYNTFSVAGEASQAPVLYALKQLGANRVFQFMIVVGALMGMISSLLVFQYGQTRIWFAMSRDGLLHLQDSSLVHLDRRSRGRSARRGSRHWPGGRPVQHRHPVRLCSGLVGSNLLASQPTGSQTGVSGPFCPALPHNFHRPLCRPDGRPVGGDLAPVLRLDGHWIGDLLPVQSPPQ
jgi:APA family basic amino acid/polyamine antiporter